MAKGKIKTVPTKPEYMTRFDVPVTDGWMVEGKILKPIIKYRYAGRVGDVKLFPADLADTLIKEGYIIKT
jgi:hypothetical protein